MLLALGATANAGPARSALQGNPYDHVGLAFAGQNLQAPVSAFGHTFLVFYNGDRPGALSPTLEFVGELDPESAWSPLAAIFSSIPGTYVERPLFLKGRQYENENRDIWIYELKVSRAQLMRLQDEAVKRLGAEYRYRFVKHNCSYYIQDLIESSVDLDPACATGWTTIPIRTVQGLHACGFLGRLHYLPSFARKMVSAQQDLTADEKTQVNEWTRWQQIDTKTASKRLVAAADLAADYVMIHSSDPEARVAAFDLKRRVVSLSEVPVRQADPASHAQTRYAGVLATNAFGELQYLHSNQDLFTRDSELEQFGDLEVGHVALFKDARHFALGELILLKMLNTRPDRSYETGFTRYGLIQYENHSRGDSKRGSEINIRWGFGKSFALIPDTVSASVIPYLGVRPAYFVDDRTRVQSDIGAVFALESMWAPLPAIRLLINPILEPTLEYRMVSDLSAKVFQTSTWGAGLRYRLYDLDWTGSWGGVEGVFFL